MSLDYLAKYYEENPIVRNSGGWGGRGSQRYYTAASENESRCWACGGEHASTVCKVKRCFRCAEAGHEMSDCVQQIECRACQMFGHSSNDPSCFKLQYDLGLQRREQRKSYHGQDSTVSREDGRGGSSQESSHVKYRWRR